MNFKSLLTSVLAFFVLTISYAQPSNDDCINAINITDLDGTCANYDFTNPTFDEFTCNTNEGFVNTWFTFTANGPDIDITVSGINRPEIALGEFAPGQNCDIFGATLFACEDANGNYTSITMSETGILTQGNTYFIQITNNNDANGTFDLCVTNPTAVLGCTDPAASNYDPAATADDGSCTYAGGCSGGGTLVPATNDGCGDAYDLGSLPAPANCSGTTMQIGAQVAYCANTFNATPNDGTYPANCMPSSLANDVWFTFTATGSQLDVDIQGFNTPHIGIFHGSCGGLIVDGCLSGSGGSLNGSFSSLSVGTTYYLQVYGDDLTDDDAFTITLNNNNVCDACFISGGLTATPPPVNGYYENGTTISFCLTVDEWDQVEDNWIHGVTPIFGAGWDVSTFNPVSDPGSFTYGGPPGPSYTAQWSYYNTTVTSSATGQSFGPGWFVENNNGTGSNNSDPGDNYGDPRTGPFEFCFEIEPVDCAHNADLTIQMNTSADGESGGWNSPGCGSDVVYQSTANLACCSAPTTTVTQNNTVWCPGDPCAGIASVTGVGGITPYDYVWVDALSNNVVATSLNNPTTDTQSGLCTGSYIVSVTDDVGCTRRGVITILGPDTLEVSVTNTVNATCAVPCDGEISIDVTGGTTGYSFAWDGPNGYSSTDEDLNTLCDAGTYNLTITDNIGCVTTTSATITSASQLTVSPAITSITCNSDNDGELSLTVTGGAGSGYTYSWSNSATTSAITGLNQGTYSVSISDGTCDVINSYTITEPSALTISSINTSVTCNGTSDGSIDLTLIGGNSNYTFSWSNGSTTEDLTGLVAGSYTVTATDGPCVITLTSTINEPSAITLSATGINPSCNGSNNGVIDLTASGGNNNYTYLWSNGAITQDISGLSGGTFTVSVLDNGACNTTISETLIEPTSITISSTVTDAACGVPDGSIVTNVSGGGTSYNYIWSNGETTATITGLNAGSLVLTVTDNNGCTSTTTELVNNPAPSVTVSAITTVTCFGGSDGSVTVTASGGNTPYSFEWNSNPIQINTTGVATGLSAGNYIVTVEDNSNCIALANFSVDESTSVTAIGVVTNPSCNGDSDGSVSVTISGGTSPYTYTWSNGETTQNITGLTAGDYQLQIEDANNCVSGDPGISTCVEIRSLLADACGSPEDNNEMVRFQIGSAGADISDISVDWPNLSWNGYCQSAATATIVSNINATIVGGGQLIEPMTSIPPFAHVIVITSDNFDWSSHDWSALDYDLYIVFQCDAGSTAYYKNYDTSCGTCNNNRTTTVNVATCSDVVSYIPSQLLGTGDGDGVEFDDAGNPTYINNGCAAPTVLQQPPVDPLEFTVSITPALSLTTNNVINVDCNGNSTGSIDITSSGGTSPYSYLWSNGATTTSISALPQGTYTATVTDNNACFVTVTETIAEPTVLQITMTCNNTSSIGGSDGSSVAAVAGGTTPYVYNWTNTSQTSSTVTGLTTNTYTVTATDANGCQISQTCSVSDPSCALSLTISANNVSCNGGSDGLLTANASGGDTPYSYNWNSGSIQQTATGLGAGTFRVTIIDNIGCNITGTEAITEPTVLTSSIVCNNTSSIGGTDGSSTVSINGGQTPYSYSWSATGSSLNSATGLSSGTISVTATDNNGCEIVESCSVSDPSCNMSVTMVLTQVSCNGGSDGEAIAVVSGGTTPYGYTWSSSSNTKATESDLTAGTYTVTLTDGIGCTLTEAFTITEPSALTISTTVTSQPTCSNSSDGMATVIVNGGTPGYQYAWSTSPVQTTATVSGLYQSTTITVSDNNSCSSTSVVTVSVPSPLSTTISTNNVSCNNGSDGASNVTVTGGTPPYVYNWSNGTTLNSTTGLVAGNIDVTVTDNNNCQIIDNATITQPSSITLSTTTTFASCGGSDGSASVSATGGTTDYSYVWSYLGQTTATATGLSAGNYNVTVADNNGCTTSTNSLVSNPAPDVTVTAVTTVTCFGGSDGNVTVTASGGTTPYNYSWNSSPSQTNTTGYATGLSAGNYVVTVSDDLNCIALEAFTIDENTEVDLQTTISNPTCFGSSDGSIFANASGGGGTSFSYLWTNGSTSSSVTGLVAGNYTVSVTNSLGCVDIFTLPTVNPSVFEACYSYTDDLCNSGNLASATISASGGTSPYSFIWSTGQTTENLTGIGAGVYSVTGTDANGCAVQFCDTLSTPCFEIRRILVDACETSGEGKEEMFYMETGSAIFNVSNLSVSWPTTSFSWGGACTNPTFISNVNATIVGGGYLVEPVGGVIPPNSKVLVITGNVPTTSAMDFSGLNDTLVVIFQCADRIGGHFGNQNNSPGIRTLTVYWDGCTDQVSYDRTQLVMQDGSIGDEDGAMVEYTDDGTPSYYNEGCIAPYDTLSITSFVTFTVTEPSAITVTANQNNVSCNNMSDGSINLNVSGGTSPYTYIWNTSPVQTTASISGLSAGVYNSTVTDNNGCIAIESTTISQPLALTVSLSAGNPNCFNSSDGTVSISANGGTTPYTYTWNNSLTSASSSGLTSGVYSITTSDANNCSSIQSSTLTSPSNITATFSATGETCGSNDGTASVTVTGGNSPYNFSWNGQTTATVTGLSAGKNYISITDASSCFYLDSVTVPQISNLIVGSTVISITCNGDDDGSIALNPTSGITPYSYVWNNGSTTNSENSLSPGTYNITVTDGSGCTATVTETITEPNPINLTITTTDVLCFGQNDGAITVTPSGGNSPYTYSFSNGASGSSTVSGLNAGNVCVTVSDNSGCSTTACENILEPQEILLSILSSTDVSCFGGSDGQLSISTTGGTGSIDYSWNNGATSSNISGLSSGIYTVTASDDNSCIAELTVTISSPTAVNITITSVTDASCVGVSDGQAVILVNGGASTYNYNWNNGNTTSSLTNVLSGNYSLTVTDANNCGVDTIVSIAAGEVIADFDYTANSEFVPVDVQFNNTSQGATIYEWAFGTGETSDVINPVYTYTASGTYQVTLTAYLDINKLCLDTAIQTIDLGIEPSFEIAQVFSPNGDGVNDVFTINGINIFDVEGVIYNRWGTEINSWNTIQGGWDGRTYSGVDVPAGTYFYIIKVKVTEEDDWTEPFKGSVTLVR